MSRPPEWDAADKHFGLGEHAPAPEVDFVDVSRRDPLTEDVTCCDDCPFSVARIARYGPDAFWCNHGALGRVARAVDDASAGIPTWCPLRSGPTLVQLRVST